LSIIFFTGTIALVCFVIDMTIALWEDGRMSYKILAVIIGGPLLIITYVILREIHKFITHKEVEMS